MSRNIYSDIRICQEINPDCSLQPHPIPVILSEGGAFAAAVEGPEALQPTTTAWTFQPIQPLSLPVLTRYKPLKTNNRPILESFFIKKRPKKHMSSTQTM